MAWRREPRRKRGADESRAAPPRAATGDARRVDTSQLDSLERGLAVLAEMTRMLHERQP